MNVKHSHTVCRCLTVSLHAFQSHGSDTTVRLETEYGHCSPQSQKEEKCQGSSLQTAALHDLGLPPMKKEETQVRLDSSSCSYICAASPALGRISAGILAAQPPAASWFGIPLPKVC